MKVNLLLILKKIYKKFFLKNKELSLSFPHLIQKYQIPLDLTEDDLYEIVSSVRIDDAPEEELLNYVKSDFKRFVYTYNLASNLEGECLELGANPYFTSILLKQFSSLKLTFANFFGNNITTKKGSQVIKYKSIDGADCEEKIIFDHFNVENDSFPYKDSSYDVVIFAEIIEHLTTDPMITLLEIKRVLKLNGCLILTTPNVARLENVARLINGTNIYDPYSGYGPYGRHNREFNKHELFSLLKLLGFDINVIFSSDVHENNANYFADMSLMIKNLKHREHDLGQYIFIKATKINETKHYKKPSWLYRSYPPDDLDGNYL